MKWGIANRQAHNPWRMVLNIDLLFVAVDITKGQRTGFRNPDAGRKQKLHQRRFQHGVACGQNLWGLFNTWDARKCLVIFPERNLVLAPVLLLDIVPELFQCGDIDIDCPWLQLFHVQEAEKQTEFVIIQQVRTLGSKEHDTPDKKIFRQET